MLFLRIIFRASPGPAQHETEFIITELATILPSSSEQANGHSAFIKSLCALYLNHFASGSKVSPRASLLLLTVPIAQKSKNRNPVAVEKQIFLQKYSVSSILISSLSILNTLHLLAKDALLSQPRYFFNMFCMI